MSLPRTVCVAALVVLTASCYSTPPKIYQSLEASPALYAVRPVDIAILPVEDASAYGAAHEVLEALRAALAVAIIRQGYTPLATPKIDQVLRQAGSIEPEISVVDAAWLKSLGGKFGEDATLGVRITSWDVSSLMSTGWVRFGLDVAMVSPANETPLWFGNIKGEVKAGGDGAAPTGRHRRLLSVSKELANEMMRFLPKRML